MPRPTATVEEFPRTAVVPPSPRTQPILLVLEKGATRRHYFLVTGNPVSFGRERGNEVILRAFKKSGDLDHTETNKLSRRHLVLTIEDQRALVLDERSAFHTTVGKRGKLEQIPKGVEVELPDDFEVGFAISTIKVRGRIHKDAKGRIESVRVARSDEEAAHVYLIHRTRTSIGGSDKDDALRLEGAPAGAAQLEVEESGAVRVRARGDQVFLGGKALAPGESATLVPGQALALGPAVLAVRSYGDEDFFKPAWRKS